MVAVVVAAAAASAAATDTRRAGPGCRRRARAADCCLLFHFTLNEPAHAAAVVEHPQRPAAGGAHEIVLALDLARPPTAGDDVGPEGFAERTRQVLETGAATVATACPFCMVMLSDGLAAADGGSAVVALDVSEVLAARLASIPEDRRLPIV
jgi:hypothetical protein